MLFVVGGQLGGSLGRGTRGTSSTAAPPLLSSGLASGSKSCTAPNRSSLLQSMRSWPVRVIIRHQGRPGRAEMDACQGSIPDLISSHLIWAPSLHQRAPNLGPDLVLCQTSYVDIVLLTAYIDRCIYNKCMRACAQMSIYDWLYPLYTQSTTPFPSVPCATSNSLCQSPSPQHPPPCLLPVPKLRLSG